MPEEHAIIFYHLKEKVDIFDCKVFHLGGAELLKLLDGQVSVDLLKEAKEVV